MKNILRTVGLVAAVVLVLPSVAYASVFISHQDYTLARSQAVGEDLYVWAGRASLAGQVSGDLMLGAGTATVTGTVLGDAMVLGGNLDLIGSVGDDVRMVGGQLNLGGSVGGDVVAAGGTLHVFPDAVIQGDLHVAGGNVVIDGTVRGDVVMTGGQLTINGTVLGGVQARVKNELIIGPDAAITGVLQYEAPREANVPPGVRVGGGIRFTGAAGAVKAGVGVGADVAGGLLGFIAGLVFTFKLLTWLGFALLIVWLWRSWALGTVQELHDAFFRSFGQGILVFLAVPLALGLLLISFVGTMVGVAGIALYALMLILSRALAGVFFGAWLAKVVKRRSTLHLTFGWTILGVVVLQVLAFVPFIGWLVSSVLALGLLGVLFRRVWNVLHR